LKQEEPKPQRTKSRKEKLVAIMPPAPGKQTPVPVASNDEIRQRIVVLKEKQTVQPESDKRRFEYDPDQPLHLVQEEEKA